MNALSLYARYAGISARAQLQYRASLILLSVGTFLIAGSEFIGLWAIVDRFGNLRGWRLPEIALFYGMISITWSIAESIGRGFDQFAATVKSGEFDRILLRPRSTVLQLIGQEVTLRRIGRFSQGLAVLVYAFVASGMSLSPERTGLLVLTVVGGVCAFLGLLVFQATSAFWTTESLEVWNAFTYGGVFMSQYPMSIYRPAFRRFFTFVIPLACINYFPCVAMLGRPDPLGTTRVFQCAAPLSGVVFLVASLFVWRVGVRHYRSTGS